MLIRVRGYRVATNEVIDYCDRLSREFVQFHGCQVALQKIKEEICEGFPDDWEMEIWQVTEHEYDRWRLERQHEKEVAQI